jgi:RNA-directed DNA polymerase
MSFRDFLEQAIREEARKLIRRQERYAKEVDDELKRMKRRTGILPVKEIHCPAYWKADPGFDPYHVRANAAAYAHSIEKSLRRSRYKPRPAIVYRVPKSDGSMRAVSVFQVADNALSRFVYKNLIAKNAPRFSSRCYAYRTDVTLHDAVQHISAQFRRESRLYVAEFDFSKFFDTLKHDLLERIIEDRKFLVSQREHRIIRAFLRTPSLDIDQYSASSSEIRLIGIPQGTSISLFLANAAGSYLDDQLERLGVGFARYADDTLIWSSDYMQVLSASQALADSGRDLGARVNLKKSAGIAILRRSGEVAEFRSKDEVNFIGYSISRHSISMSPTNVVNIKRRIAQIVYRNLLEPVRKNTLQLQQVSGQVDRDYLVMILQLRRYLYGGLSESKLRAFSSQATARIHFKGLMSFYPIVDNKSQLAELDGWLLHTVYTAVRIRGKKITSQFGTSPSPCSEVAKSELIDLTVTTDGKFFDLRLPSFVRISRLISRMANIFGPNQIANLNATPYYD